MKIIKETKAIPLKHVHSFTYLAFAFLHSFHSNPIKILSVLLLSTSISIIIACMTFSLSVIPLSHIAQHILPLIIHQVHMCKNKDFHNLQHSGCYDDLNYSYICLHTFNTSIIKVQHLDILTSFTSTLECLAKSTSSIKHDMFFLHRFYCYAVLNTRRHKTVSTFYIMILCLVLHLDVIVFYNSKLI